MSTTLKNDMRQAMQQQLERGLVNSAKKIGEILTSLPKQQQQAKQQHFDLAFDDLLADIVDAYYFAKSLFDTKEYLRCSETLAQVLQHLPQQLTAWHKKALFLRCYSLYLAGEKRKEEEIFELKDQQLATQVLNKQWNKTESILQSHFQQDGYLCYLYALVAPKSKRFTLLVQSVIQEPCLWCSWHELCKEETKRVYAFLDEQQSPSATYQFMKQVFQGQFYLDIQENEQALQKFEELDAKFEKKGLIEMLKATSYYQMGDFDIAQRKFEFVMKQDPCKLDFWDTYSNILYVKRSRADLSFLAKKCMELDKYRPESCCIIGNFYSLRGDHDRAVHYFQRALKLDRHYLSAWTLMGHELLELKKVSAAIHAYRTAVDFQPRDFRAWYGLGQAYEFVSKNTYALYYYGKATSLKPNDGRMWMAMAACYEEERKVEAIMCYKRAEALIPNDPHIYCKLISLYEKAEQYEYATFYALTILRKREADLVSQHDTVQEDKTPKLAATTREHEGVAYAFLASYYAMKGKFTAVSKLYREFMHKHAEEAFNDSAIKSMHDAYAASMKK